MYINDGKLNFQNILLSEYIDKSSLISYTNKSLYSPSTKFLCVSRPRRFGKSYTANMLAAYYSKGCDSHDLFSKLEISKEESYEKYINKFNVITLDIQSMIALNQGAKGVVSYIQKSVCKELADEFSDIHFLKTISLRLSLIFLIKQMKNLSLFLMSMTAYFVIIQMKKKRLKHT
jgi:hypothetical protein